MPKIKTLPPKVVEKIAAGEVIENPASIVKELIENSLDAEATQIKVELKNAGKQKIMVTDNGHGMAEDDLVLSVAPHATSKITHLDDLMGVLSFGFRGEALSSMAQVSHIKIASREKKKKIGMLYSHQLEKTTPQGMPQGTQVVIENLFATIPARKKFLKSATVELNKIIEVVTHQALSSYQVGFQLFNDQKLITEIPAEQNFSERVSELLGLSPQELLPVDFSQPHLEITGLIGRPPLSRSNNNRQYLFVNHRSVSHPGLQNTIRHTYGNLLEKNRQPVFALFIKVPPQTVDINTHPRKETLTFMDEELIKEMMTAAIKQTLFAETLYDHGGNTELTLKDNEYRLSHLSQELKEIVTPWSVKDLSLSKQVLQVHDLYLITQTQTGVVLIDQHAAHERILYEQFKAALINQSRQSHYLKESLVLELSPADFRLLTNYLETLTKLGFELSPFGKKSFKVNAVPELLKDHHLKELLLNILDELNEHQTTYQTDTLIERTLSSLACRAAIKAGDSLTPSEAKKLLKKLALTKTQYACPHGRPVSISLNLNELAKMFKRIK
jgi:DNA mismatch repair protein MutL